MVRITNTHTHTHTNSSIRKWVLLAKEQSRKRHTGNSNKYSLQMMMMMMMSVAKALWVLGSFGLFSLLACHSMVAAEARTLCGSKNTHIAAAKDKHTHIQAGRRAGKQPASHQAIHPRSLAQAHIHIHFIVINIIIINNNNVVVVTISSELGLWLALALIQKMLALPGLAAWHAHASQNNQMNVKSVLCGWACCWRRWLC